MKEIIIFGGAGFIGINAAQTFLKKGYQVHIFDNLSRQGTLKNLDWLKTQGKFKFTKGDIRNGEQVLDFLLSHPNTTAVLHLAAQVAVTTSIDAPREDFETNALGTFNILEGLRSLKSKGKNPFLIYASTNKVYGSLSHLKVLEEKDHYAFQQPIDSISEVHPLDFHSPYGCSKGTGDQYVLDYSRIYGIQASSFRQSCIYGYRQFGIEDQGWVAWFTIASVLNKPITIYGNGKQVRDILFIDDLIACYVGAVENPDKISGKAYNIGGGPQCTLSLLQLIEELKILNKKNINLKFSTLRPGDQPIFICNIQKIYKDLQWAPKISPQQGIRKLYDWVYTHQDLFKD
ncbi:MAG: CDP-paratose 2-epimerase [Deltaproteobacteria bacterium GWA2_38_16]|nr:MAG: CDP-paratose 2-epimerase [Deltaproteobacteria bacterium GWA2_38_16]OGQ02492.1 MAG: CDP-paratose 2-epimerase [Deltaproteobacteria bacterium RIFCSPHIGHO2_02_FULL_38_15]OGQ33217.1 MAG: CDP-paratose 2-epimerase [Deltaproteobacteria bacterium RIFCSPLOWO2_01_FULL_38_9]HBQ21053.1 CDP-paratose 2-epimerase [Deltaproteobacteria bacterium]